MSGQTLNPNHSPIAQRIDNADLYQNIGDLVVTTARAGDPTHLLKVTSEMMYSCCLSIFKAAYERAKWDTEDDTQ
jgi:hypothetical protein